eukprot:SAG31_NODE_1_length_62978_cov_30.836130_6_plen_210_part_00
MSVYNGRLEVQPVVEFAARQLNFDPTTLLSWGLHVNERRAQKLGWTKWFNGEPPSFSGDVEMLTAIRNPDHVYWRNTKYDSICNGEDPINIQCRTISGVPWNETGQKFDVPCVPTKGLSCRHCHNNADCVGKPCRHCRSGCLDYEVRYKCCAQKCKRDSDCASFRPTCSNGCCKEFSDILAEPIVEDNIIERGVTNDGQQYTIEKMQGS